MNIKGIIVLYCLGFLSVVAGFVAGAFTYPFSPLNITLYLLGAILGALGVGLLLKKKNTLVSRKDVAVVYCLGFLSVAAGFVVNDFTGPQHYPTFGLMLYTLGAFLFTLGASFLVKKRNENRMN